MHFSLETMAAVMHRGGNARQERSTKFESGMREECGLFGIVSTGNWTADTNLSHLIHLGLVGLQHR